MKKIFLFFLALPLFGAKLISYNIYDRNDRVDVMLSFDSAYSGNISQKTEKNFTLLTLSELSFPKNELKNLNSSLVDKIQISSKNNKTYIMFQNKTKVSLETSAINDKFGVRIRVTNENTNLNQKNQVSSQNLSPASSQNLSPASSQNLNSSLNSNLKQNPAASVSANASILNTNDQELKPKTSSLEGFNYTQYLLVMLVLVLILIALWWFKKIMSQKGYINSKNFNVAFQRPLDKNNQFMILEYKNKRYAMIIGASNVLLESVEFTEDDRKDEFTKKDEFKKNEFSKNEFKKDEFKKDEFRKDEFKKDEFKIDEFKKDEFARKDDFNKENFDSVFEENKRKIQNLIQKNSKAES